MNVFTRGVRNAFRNGIRTGAIVLILGLCIGLCFTMLIAHRAVTNKIESVKSSVGNTITVSPAGFNPGSQVNNALTTTALDKVKSLPHVAAVTETLTDRLPTTGSQTASFGRFGSSSSSDSTTSLTSPTTINTSGNGNGGGHFFVSGGDGSGTLPTNFSLPVSFLGTTDPTEIDGSSIKVTSGSTIDGSKDSGNVLISSAMATKNNLKVGSTFSAYNSTLTVGGIFSSTNQEASGTVVLALPTLERLSGQSGVVTNAVVTVDSLNNLAATTTSVKNSLGSNADVVSAQQTADNAVQPLNSVKQISLFSLIGAVVASVVIILLVMVMIVRERKREIGVIKAIGGSNARIMGEFMAESFVLAVLGVIIGLIIGIIGGQPVTNMLVSNSSTSTAGPANSFAMGDSTGRPQFDNGGTGIKTGDSGSSNGPARGFRASSTFRGVSNIKTQIGWNVLLDGLGLAIAIAVLGSALSAGMISKIRPAEVLRSI